MRPWSKDWQQSASLKTRQILVLVATVATIAALFAVASLIALAAVTRGVSEDYKNEWHSLDRRAEYAADTYIPTQSACMMLPEAEKAYCISKAHVDYRANERNEQDLLAQQSTATWTFIMGIAAIAGIAMSAIGVLLVYFTFRETKLTAKIAVDGFRRSHDANAAHFIVGDTMVKSGSRWCVCVTNHGQTIGFALRYMIEAVETLPDRKEWRESKKDNDFISLVAPLEAGGELREAASITNVPATASHIIGKIDYIDVFKVRHLSGFRYDRSGNSWRVHRLGDWCFMKPKDQ